MRVSLIMLACLACAPAVPIENCDEGFRDAWWYIDPAVTDDHNIAATCFYLDTNGSVSTVSYDSDFTTEGSWTCIGDNEVRIKGRGSATFLPSEDPDLWTVDLNLTIPPLNETAEVEPCFWLDY